MGFRLFFDYRLVYIEYEVGLSQSDFIKEKVLIDHVYNLAKNILLKFESSSLKEKMLLLQNENIERTDIIPYFKPTNESSIKNKKWFQFWK